MEDFRTDRKRLLLSQKNKNKGIGVQEHERRKASEK